MPSDNVDDLKVEDVHVNSEISSVIEDTSIDPCPSILNEIPMSSASTSDVVDALVDFSTLTLMRFIFMRKIKRVKKQG